MLPVSKDTLLRVVRRRHRPPADPLRVIGIDDWAWRRNHRYASIICNSEGRRIVTLLPDWEPAIAQAWLAAHSAISVVARDRGGGYGKGPAARGTVRRSLASDGERQSGLPAFLDAVRKSMSQIRSAIGATTIDRRLLTAAERLQYEGYLRREETNATILALSKNGLPIKQIVRLTGHSKEDGEAGDRHGRGNRSWRTNLGRGARDHRRIPLDDRCKPEDGLIPWIERARTRIVASFASGVAKEEAAVQAAICVALVEWTDRRPDHTPRARQTSNVRPRKNRFASSQANRCRVNGAAPKLRQSPDWTPTPRKRSLFYAETRSSELQY